MSMSKFSYIVPRDLLISILNIAYGVYSNNTRGGFIGVSIPFYRREHFFELDINEDNVEVSIPISKKEYDYLRNKLYDTLINESRFDPRIIKTAFDRAIPKSDIVRDLLYFSGVIFPKNWDELVITLNDFCKRDVYRGEKIGIVTFDTNIFRKGLILHILNYVKKRRCKIGYLLLRGVMEEILNKLRNTKYSRNDIRILSNTELYGNSASDMFMNQLILDERFWMEAYQDYLLLKNEITSYEMESIKGDEALIEAIKAFESERRADVLLVTMDETFASKAVGENIRTVLLEQHPVSEFFETSFITPWENASLLLYYSAIAYGMIRLDIQHEQGFGQVIIYGIWKGKRKEDWDRRCVKIETNDKILSEKFNRLLKPLLS